MDETVQEFYENAQQPHISSRAREEQRDELFSGELQCLTLSVQTEQSRAEQVTDQRAQRHCSWKH